MQPRLTRRMAGVLKARLPEIGFSEVADPRDRRGKRWPLATLLNAVTVAIVAGCKSFSETEKLTAEMSRPMARTLNVRRRLPDTTMRDAMVMVEPDELRGRIHAQIHAAYRRKALAPQGVPFGVCAIDGKYTSLQDWDDARAGRDDWPAWNETYAQKQTHTEGGGSSRKLGTMTCCLVSSRGAPCLDAVPIPAKTNEMGHFRVVLAGLHQAYGQIAPYRMISTDAGMCSEENASLVVDGYRLDYLFGLKGNQPTLREEAERVLASRTDADAGTEDVVGKTTVTRRVYVTSEMAAFLDWVHLETVLRIESTTTVIETGEVLAHENRYYLSSLDTAGLTAEQWLAVVRMHWAVENNNHNTFDTAFAEDDRPWITAHPKGMVNVLLLRRIAYNIATMFRSVTQRSDERRATPWKDILRWFYNTLIAATDADLAGLRTRKVAAICI